LRGSSDPVGSLEFAGSVWKKADSVIPGLLGCTFLSSVYELRKLTPAAEAFGVRAVNYGFGLSLEFGQQVHERLCQ
jgi:hypothetical protein